MGFKELTAQREDAVVAAQILLQLVDFEACHGLQHVGLRLHHEVLLLRKADSSRSNQLRCAFKELYAILYINMKVKLAFC